MILTKAIASAMLKNKNGIPMMIRPTFHFFIGGFLSQGSFFISTPHDENYEHSFVFGVEGFEPPLSSSKGSDLTTCPHPAV
jgi:hypothetical protein